MRNTFISKSRTTHLHVDDGAENGAIVLIAQCQFDADADRRVARGDREIEEIGVLRVGAQRARALAQMVASLLQFLRQRE